jgi:hypothetical protein
VAAVSEPLIFWPVRSRAIKAKSGIGEMSKVESQMSKD